MLLKLIPCCKPADYWMLWVTQGSLSHPNMIRTTHTVRFFTSELLLGNAGLFDSAPANGVCPQTRVRAGLSELPGQALAACLGSHLSTLLMFPGLGEASDT